MTKKPDVFEIDHKTNTFLWNKLDDLEEECFKELQEHENLDSMEKLDVALALTQLAVEKMYCIFEMLAEDDRFEEEYKWDDEEDRLSMFDCIENRARAHMVHSQCDHFLQIYYGHKAGDA